MIIFLKNCEIPLVKTKTFQNIELSEKIIKGVSGLCNKKRWMDTVENRFFDKRIL